jgi:hypothetical protein
LITFDELGFCIILKMPILPKNELDKGQEICFRKSAVFSKHIPFFEVSPSFFALGFSAPPKPWGSPSA